MAKTKTAKAGLKRLWGWVPAIRHAQAKASAAMHGYDLQDFVAEAVIEKIQREEQEKKACNG